MVHWVNFKMDYRRQNLVRLSKVMKKERAQTIGMKRETQWNIHLFFNKIILWSNWVPEHSQWRTCEKCRSPMRKPLLTSSLELLWTEPAGNSSSGLVSPSPAHFSPVNHFRQNLNNFSSKKERFFWEGEN